MSFLINEAYLPATLTVEPMTDEQFAAFCSEHPDLFFEMSAEGELIVLPPTAFDTGARNSDLIVQLGFWARRDRRGIVSDSSAGFVLPNGARRSPDASWTLRSRIESLSPTQHASFLPLCPDFVVEIKSKSDRRKTIQAKMNEYISQGAQLGWLIDPAAQSIEIYRPNTEPELLLNPQTLPATAPLTGFILDLSTIWNPLAP